MQNIQIYLFWHSGHTFIGTFVWKLFHSEMIVIKTKATVCPMKQIHFHNINIFHSNSKIEF